MLRAYKYRIYPTNNQLVLIERTFGACRLIYNLALETKISAWEAGRINLSAFDLIKQLPPLKDAYSWMSEVDSQALQSSIKNVEHSFRNFFNGSGFPRFKSKKDRQTFNCPNNTRKINWIKSTITIPKIKDIPIVLDRTFKGEIRSITISKTTTGKYFASVLVQNDNRLPAKPSITKEKAIGIDIGLKTFAVVSNGRSFMSNKYLKKSLNRIKCLQRRIYRKRKGSKNAKKAKHRLSILHEKIKNQRKDYCHKITTSLVRDNQTDTIVVESLAISNMMRNRRLSQSIQDASWGEFYRQMKYKCEWYGKNMIQIGIFEPSSKTCSNCGEIKKQLPLEYREWTCDNCGILHDRDLNAAINIRNIGLEKYSRQGMPGEPVESRRLRRAKKQEL